MNQKIETLEKLLKQAEENNSLENRNALMTFWNEVANELATSDKALALQYNERVQTVWKNRNKVAEKEIHAELKEADVELKEANVQKQEKPTKKKTWKKVLIGGIVVALLGGCTGKMILDKSQPVAQEVTIEKTTEKEVSPINIKQDEQVIETAIDLLNKVRPYTADIDGAMFYDTLLVTQQDEVLSDKDFMAGKNYGNAKEKQMLLNVFHTFQHIANAYTKRVTAGEKEMLNFSIFFDGEDFDLTFKVEKLTNEIIRLVHKEAKTEDDIRMLKYSKKELTDIFTDLAFDQTTYSNYVKLFVSDIALAAHADVAGYGEPIFEQAVYNALFDQVKNCLGSIQSETTITDGQTLRETAYFSMDAKTLAERLYQNANGKVGNILTRDEIVEEINKSLVDVKTPIEYAKEHSENKDLQFLGQEGQINIDGLSVEGTTIDISDGVPRAEQQQTGTSTETVITEEKPNYDDPNNGQVIDETVENVNEYDPAKGTVEIENPNTGEKTEVEIKDGSLTDQIDPSKQWQESDFNPIPQPGEIKESYEIDLNGFTGDPNGFTGDPNGFTGDPNGFTGDPNGFTGDPNGFTGDPNGFTGDPNGEVNENETPSNETSSLTKQISELQELVDELLKREAVVKAEPNGNSLTLTIRL